MINYIFSKVLFMSAAGGLVIVLIALIGLWSKKALSSRWNYYIWLFAAIVLLIPVSSFPVSDIFNTTYIKTAQEGINADVQNGETVLQQNGDGKSETVQEAAGQTETTEQGEKAVSYTKTLKTPQENGSWGTFIGITGNVLNIIPFIWLFGVLLLLLIKILQRIYFSFSMKRLAVLPEDVQKEALEKTKSEMGIKRKIRLRCFLTDSSPFVTGVFRPVIYIPKELLSEEELCLTFRHELMHCMRRDLLYKTVIDFLTVLHFFNPLVYYMKNKVDTLCELSCDEELVRKMDTEMRQKYGIMLLERARDSRRLFGGSAALFEQRKTLKRRVEIIMKNKPIKKRTAMVSLVLAVIMGISCFSLAGIVNAQNTAELPRASYVTDEISYVNFTCEDETVDDSFGTIYLLRENGAAVTYTNFAGYTKFEASFFAMNENGQELVDALPIEEVDAVFNNPEYYTDYYVVTMDKAERKYGDGFGIEGLFTLTKNGEIIFENQCGYLTYLPSVIVSQTYPDYVNSNLHVDFQQDGEQVTFRLDVRMMELDSEQIRENRIRRAELERDLSTKSVTLGKILSSSIDGQEQDYTRLNSNLEQAKEEGRLWDYNSGKILYNTGQQNAQFMQSIGYIAFIQLYNNITCTEDEIKGDFILTLGSINVDVFSGTVSGLSNPVGGAVTLESDNGRYKVSWEITEFVLAPLTVYGTRDPQEFYTEGEDVFIGTPYEQDQFDRSEHDRLYKRIIVDEAGKVLAVVPVEMQSPEILNNLEERLRDIQYSLSTNWQGMFGSYVVSAVTGEVRKDTLVLQDPGTWWYRAVIPPENQYFIRKDQ